MDLDIVFENEKTYEVGHRSKIAISSHSNRKVVEERIVYQCTGAKDRVKKWRSSTYDKDYNRLFLHNSVSSYRRSLPSRSVGMDVKDIGVIKRGSMYQSSEEVRRMQEVIDRRNVKKDLCDDAFLSFEVIKSSPRSSSKESVYCPQETKEALVSLNLDSDSSSIGSNKLFPRENLEFLDLSFRDLLEEHSKTSISCSNADPESKSSADSLSEMRSLMKDISWLAGKEAPEFIEKVRVKETKPGTLQLLSDGVDATIIYERDSICILPKSFSPKLGTLKKHYHSEQETLRSSAKTHSSSFKKLLDPILKSSTRRNPLLMESETSTITASNTPCLSRHKFFPKSLLNDFSRASQKIENDKALNGSDNMILTATSPAHLHAILRWESNHGALQYEFSVKDAEDVLCAKRWKAENAFNWVYTFHCYKKKSNIHNNRTTDRLDQFSLMIGQMQVSCYFCPEITCAPSFDNTCVTEFILYDISQARKKNTVERSHLPITNQTASLTVAESLFTESSFESNRLIKDEKYQCPISFNSSSDSNPSTFPLAPTELQPNLEIATIVIQIPFSKEDYLKNIQEEDMRNSLNKGFSSVSRVDKSRVSIVNCPRPAYVKVVVPNGRHGLPNCEETGPSTLLDRWRFGGGCDCGGWDMGCPVLVLETVENNNVASLTVTHQPIQLFAKGKKDKVPALTITPNDKGHYAVDFHAQLSALQAFSICISMLHVCESSSANVQDKDKHKLNYNSLKFLLEDEVKGSIEGVEDDKKRKTNRRVRQVPPSFFLDSPFSPMGRV